MPRCSSACSAPTSRRSRRSRGSRARPRICARVWVGRSASGSRPSSSFSPMPASRERLASRHSSSRFAMAASPPTRSPSTEGLLLVDKPAGITSHDVVAIARRALGEQRIGHAGTLDPFATGLLVLLAGRITRLLPYIDAEPKVYEARIRFGAETETDDASGRVVREAPLPIRADVDRGIAALTGTLDQEPPAYSAKQVGGRRAYDAARRGTPVKLPASRVTVHSWEVKARANDTLDAVVTCSGGTYVRALARDLGRHAGS